MKKLNGWIAAGAVLVLSFVVARIGIDGIVEQMIAICAVLPALLALSLLRLILQTLAWSKVLRAEGIQAGFLELAGARVSSRALGYLSVLGPMVAEPLRISMLRRRSDAATAATLIDTGVYWFSSGVCGVIGTLCALRCLGGMHYWPLMLLAALLIAGLVLIARGKPLLPVLVRGLGQRCPNSLRRAVDVEAAIRRFQVAHPGCIRSILALDLGCQVLIMAEVIAIFSCFHIHFGVGIVLAIDAANRVVKMMGGLVPARIGTDESGLAAAFAAFGLPSSSGLALALSRRTRDLLEVFVGIVWFYWVSRRPCCRCATLPGTRLAAA